MKDVKFDISSFMAMLAALGEGTHQFVFEVGDAYGTTTKTLTLRVTE